jgi:restriction system protein
MNAQASLMKQQALYAQSLPAWQRHRAAFETAQAERNAAIDRDREAYVRQVPDAIADYCDLVLSNSAYPSSFPRDYDVDYLCDSHTLVVEYVLPTLEPIPKPVFRRAI